MKKYLKHIPNALTIVRFILIPLILYLLIQNNYIGAIVVLTISGLTDILDGTIARKYNFITDFGKLMDPLADKATQIAMLITLTLNKTIPFWIVLVVAFKECLMIAGASFLYGKELVVSSKWYGKLATILFYIAIVFSLILEQIEGMLLNWNSSIKHLLLNLDLPIYCFAVLATIFSLIMYIRAFFVQGYLKKQENKAEN